MEQPGLRSCASRDLRTDAEEPEATSSCPVLCILGPWPLLLSVLSFLRSSIIAAVERRSHGREFVKGLEPHLPVNHRINAPGVYSWAPASIRDPALIRGFTVSPGPLL